MFGLGKRGSPLFDRLAEQRPMYAIMAARNRQEENRLVTVVALVEMLCAGTFLGNSSGKMDAVVRESSRDVLAFESLAFSIYAVRECYSPMAHGIEREIDEDYDDPEQQALGKVFRSAAGLCLTLAEEETGWRHLDDVLTNRLRNYHSSAQISGSDSGAERFCSILLAIGKAQRPQIRYGDVSVDAQATLEATTAVQVFGLGAALRCATTLRELRDQHGLV